MILGEGEAVTVTIKWRGFIGATMLFWGLGTCVIARAHDLAQMTQSTGLAEQKGAKLAFLDKQAAAANVPVQDRQAAWAIYRQDVLWKQTSLRICFWNGTEALQKDVMAVAAEWHDAAPVLSFDYMEGGHVRQCKLADLRNTDNLADIRINLDPNDPRPLWYKTDAEQKTGDWSHYGNEVAYQPAYPTTMNLPLVAGLSKNDPVEYHFHVRHEFGHALGLIHEHQRALCNGWFNFDRIAQDNHWTVAQAIAQVGSLPDTSNLSTSDEAAVNVAKSAGVYGEYDVNSIMQYNFELAWYIPDHDGLVNPCMRRGRPVEHLSPMDRIAIAHIYVPALNARPDRVAFLKEQARLLNVAVAAPSAGPSEPAAPGAAPNARQQDIITALETFKQNVKRHEDINIQTYYKPGDRQIISAAVSQLGYPLKVIIPGHPNPTLIGDPTNAVIFTPDVPEQDVRYVAASLLSAGVAIKSIEHYQVNEAIGRPKRTRLIQIGSDVVNRGRGTLTSAQILAGALPVYGKMEQPAPSPQAVVPAKR